MQLTSFPCSHILPQWRMGPRCCHTTSSREETTLAKDAAWSNTAVYMNRAGHVRCGLTPGGAGRHAVSRQERISIFDCPHTWKTTARVLIGRMQRGAHGGYTRNHAGPCSHRRTNSLRPRVPRCGAPVLQEFSWEEQLCDAGISAGQSTLRTCQGRERGTTISECKSCSSSSSTAVDGHIAAP